MFKLKNYLVTDCISFTFVTLVYSILSSLDVLPPFKTVLVFQMFAITTCVALLMFLTDRIPWKSLWPSMAVDILVVLLSVFTVGPLLRVFPLNWANFAVISGMSLLVYFAVYGVLMIKDRADADRINQQIQTIQKNKLRRAREEAHEQDH
ncbi:DUF3021 family protein [Paenibacillus macerans]|uniref:DUF3021 family protein n=1 Tax=Paenibacillus macerans TaxID=44252 RepID=UPI003D31B5F6